MSDEPVVKIAHHVPISREMAMDYGLIPDTRPPYVPQRPPLRYLPRRAWWKIKHGISGAFHRIATAIDGDLHCEFDDDY